MAYGDTTLGADHRWSFNNVLTDSIGSLTVTNTGLSFVTSPITRDATHSIQTNGRNDLATVATATDSGNANTSRYAFQGWFEASQIQGPPCMIYKQGGNTAGYALFLWAGNNVMLQSRNSAGNTIMQIFSDIALTDGRTYHFFVRFSGNGFSNELEFWLDGVKQTANLDGVAPNTANMAAHTGNHNWGEPGASGNEVDTGNESVIITAPINGLYAEWWTWEGADSESITEAQINNDLFGAGAIPDITISSDTEANMQTALNAINNTTRPDEPLCILVEAVTGDGDLELTATNIQFNERASIHVRYEGSGKLTWINTGTSNASRGSTTNQDIDFVSEVDVTVTVLDASTLSPIQNARVYITLDSDSSVVLSSLTNASGVATSTFNYLSDSAVSGKVRKGTTSPLYQNALISSTITSSGLDITVLMVSDE